VAVSSDGLDLLCLGTGARTQRTQLPISQLGYYCNRAMQSYELRFLFLFLFPTILALLLLSLARQWQSRLDVVEGREDFTACHAALFDCRSLSNRARLLLGASCLDSTGLPVSGVALQTFCDLFPSHSRNQALVTTILTTILRRFWDLERRVRSK
jgi:hypothetical protein